MPDIAARPRNATESATRSAASWPVRLWGGFHARLGRIPMYRVLTYLLGALFVAAAVLAWAGEITFPVRGMAETAGVLLIVGYVSNRLFAALFNVTPHSESAVITALIMFFVLSPTTDVVTLAEVALAALFASASKYVLAFRGRHVFNPAAVGAVWLAVFHMPLALWWVGTPALLPFVAVAVLLIMARTHRGMLVLIFVIAAAAGTVARTIGDQPFGSAVWFAVGQSPIVFLAGFMLTEPFTLPPRRWQQAGVALIVAALVAFPITSAHFTVGPETALLVGNLVAFVFGQRRTVELTLIAKEGLADGITEFAFHPARPITFTPGQYLELDVPHHKADRRGTRRMFSLATPPGSSDVRVAMRMPDTPSTFKTALAQLPAGATVRANIVSGDFVPHRTAAPALMVASGIGITPFLSHLQTGDHQNTVVVWVAGSAPEQRYVDIIEGSGARLVPIAAGRRLDEAALQAAAPDIRIRRTYISGSPAFVTATAGLARQLKAAHIHTDQFAGY